MHADSTRSLNADTIHDRSDHLIDFHADHLFRFALTRVRDRAVAEDLVQETFLAAIGPGDFAGRSSERTWLIGILKHKIIDHFRRSVKFEFNDGEMTDDEFFDANGRWRNDAEPSEWSSTPEEILESKELASLLDGCIAQLPEHLAAVFLLREINGLDADEICELLSISPSNYWVMLHRARLLLRQSIERLWGHRGRPRAEFRATT
jgi:RNA polymerase sigma-70 factor (ECF subfamily)